ncbi:hypothetical protein QVD17_30613 [Tagetes erecta]|uniref:Uncharacterized protein n=1 Tax=Tagetes erecta TaxID=13708 RepID=A0AAD8K5Y3_TARER|nr:hypothetical protein QVD17_30613 [Tagetes erecta]
MNDQTSHNFCVQPPYSKYAPRRLLPTDDEKKEAWWIQSCAYIQEMVDEKVKSAGQNPHKDVEEDLQDDLGDDFSNINGEDIRTPAKQSIQSIQSISKQASGWLDEEVDFNFLLL